MKITFVSNFINHHQIPFCNALYQALGDDFVFIQTQAMTKERLRDGWALDENMFAYVRFWETERELCSALFLESDVVLLGWSMLPASLIARRLQSGKVTFRATERIYKEGQWKRFSPRGIRAKWREHIRYRRKPVYLLCAGAYVASDFAKIHAYPDKRFRWGYFPETVRHRPAKWDAKGGGRIRICWAGRMIAWKHPEFALKVAKKLRDEGFSFQMEMAGDGPLKEALETYASRNGLEQYVHFKKTLTPVETRKVMEEAHLFLFTSNFLEGWGAVVNEAMNAACCVVASSEAGSVPFLIRHGENGLCYANGSYDAFEREVLRAAGDAALRRTLGLAAFETIVREWNAELAAKRFLELAGAALAGKDVKPFAGTGPVSRAPVLKAPGFLRTRQERMRQDHV